MPTTPRAFLTYVWSNRPAARPVGSRTSLSDAAKALNETPERLLSAAKSSDLWGFVRVAATGEHLELVTTHATLAGLLAEAESKGVNLDGPLPKEKP